MAIKDHGDWVRYAPDALPDGYPTNTMFCRRVSDGQDWYAYLRSGHFDPDTIKMTLCLADDDTWVIATATTDASMLFPQGAKIVEIDWDLETDQEAGLADFVGRTIYLTTGTLGPVWVHPQADKAAYPITVAASSAKLVLDDDGFYDAVEAACLTHPVTAVRIFWITANTWVEDNPYVLAISCELGLDDETMHNMFVRALAKE